jgi:hypothetical protein
MPRELETRIANTAAKQTLLRAIILNFINCYSGSS